MAISAHSHYSAEPGRLILRRDIKRAKKRKRAVRLLCAGIVGTICFSAYIAVYLINNRRDQAYYKSLSESFAPPAEIAADPVLQWEEPARPLESRQVNRTSVMDFESRRNEAPGIEGWIKIDGTQINYPIMRASDNDYYLTRLPNGTRSSSGSIFMDYRNSPDFSNRNTLIYGHRMRSGAMFGTLRYYGNQSFYDKHPTVSIFTPRGDFEVELIAGYAFDQTKETVPLRFDNEEDFDKYIADARRRSTFKSDVEVKAVDRLVTLATCEYSYNDGRLVIVGKLVEK